MNYTLYLQKVSDLVASMTPEQKDEWIMGQAVSQAAEARDSFLKSLSGKPDKEEMDFAQALKVCEEMESLEIHFSCESYEEYDNYWSDNWTIDYQDTYGTAKKLDTLLEYICNAVSHHSYKEAIVIADRILGMEFFAEDTSGGDVLELVLTEMFDNELLQFSRQDFLDMYIRGIYFYFTGEEQYRRLMETLNNLLWREYGVEDILIACALKTEEINSFLDRFIPWLGENGGNRAGEILTEASLLRGGTEKFTSAALQYGRKYPVLFVSCCEELIKEEKKESCGRVAQEAVKQLDKKLVYRGRAAALGALALEGLEENTVKLWEEAFWSESSLNHLLHLLNCDYEEQEFSALLEKERIHIGNIPERSSFYVKSEDQFDVNTLSAHQKVILKFFLTDAAESMEYCSSKKEHLGWSNEPQGVLVPLFLACVTGKRTMTRAMRAALGRITGRCGFKDTQEFWDLLVLWREKHFTADEKECLLWLEKEIIKRTDAVVGGGYRGSYDKAAELVVALDEILAEKNMRLRGETRERIRQMHSRKSSFKKEIVSLL